MASTVIKPKFSGLVCFYKPQGVGSTNVVRYVQKVLNCYYYDLSMDTVKVPTGFLPSASRVGDLARKVGHGGTLDPLAEGCLGVGDGTKLLNKFLNCTKEYLATAKLGIETDSYDIKGTVKKELPYDQINQSLLEETLSEFRGSILQVPPKFSAKQINGKRLYDLARKQPELHIEIPASQVHVHQLTCSQLEFDADGNLLPSFKLEMEVSKGTYVRSIIHDLGQKLGCGATMTNLIRTRQGPFRLENCIQLEQAKDLELLRHQLDKSWELIKEMK